jgi:hypothetical protein
MLPGEPVARVTAMSCQLYRSLVSNNNTVYELVSVATLEGGFQREEFPGSGKQVRQTPLQHNPKNTALLTIKEC